MKNQQTEDLLDRVFLSRREAQAIFNRTAKNAGILGRIKGSVFSILDWELELSTCPGGYFFRINEQKEGSGND